MRSGAELGRELERELNERPVKERVPKFQFVTDYAWLDEPA
jgi:hypothetical protein